MGETTGTCDGAQVVLPLPIFDEDLAGRMVVELSFAPPKRTADGSVQLLLLGEAGRNVVIDASENLGTWVPLTTNLNAGGTVEYVDTAAATRKWRFYRARQSE